MIFTVIVILLDIAKLNIASWCVGLCMLLDGHKNYIMKANCFFLLILLFCFTEQTPAQQVVCPPWFNSDNRSTTGHSWHQYSTKVYCGPDFLSLRFGICMTYNNTTGVTEFGACPYSGHYNTTHVVRVCYIRLPNNVSLLMSSSVGH